MNLYRFLSRSIQGSILLTLVCAVIWMLPVILGYAPADTTLALQGHTLLTIPYGVALALQFVAFVAMAIAGQRLIEVAFLAPVQTYAFYGMTLCLAISLPEIHLFTFQTIAFALIYIATNQLIRMQIFGYPSAKVVNITFALLIAACLAPSFLLLLPMFFLALIMMRQMNLRTLVAMLFTTISTVMLLAGIIYLLDQTPDFDILFPDFEPITFISIIESLEKHIWMAILLVLSMVVVVFHQIYVLRYKILVRTLHRVLALFCLGCWVLFTLLQDNGTEIAFLNILFTSLLVSSFFSNEETVLARFLYPLLVLLSLVKPFIEFFGI